MNEYWFNILLLEYDESLLIHYGTRVRAVHFKPPKLPSPENIRTHIVCVGGGGGGAFGVLDPATIPPTLLQKLLISLRPLPPPQPDFIPDPALSPVIPSLLTPSPLRPVNPGHRNPIYLLRKSTFRQSLEVRRILFGSVDF